MLFAKSREHLIFREMELIKMNENIVKIQFGDVGGTGIIIYSDKDDFAVIVTAKHCLKEIGSNLKEIKIPEYNECEVINCVVAEEADVLFLICSNLPYREVYGKFRMVVVMTNQVHV